MATTALFTTAPPACGGALPFDTRGYLELGDTRYDVNAGAIANPDNDLGLPREDRSAQLDVTGTWIRGGAKAVVEGYAQTDSAGQGDVFRANQAYVGSTLWSPDWYAKVGKVVPSWGTGQIWNPVRALTNESRRDLVQPNQALEGIDLAQLQVTLDSASSLSLYALPAQAGHAAGAALRFASSAGTFDYAASGFADGQGTRRLGLEASWVWDRLTLVAEGAAANRSSTLVISPDGTRTTRPDAWRTSYVLGGNLALGDSALLTVETFDDANGYSASEYASFTQHLPANLDLYNPLGNGRRSLYAGLTQRFLTRDSAATLGVFHNEPGHLTAIQLRLEGQLDDNVRLLLTGIRYLQPAAEPQVRLYDTYLDARIRVNF